MLARAKSGVIIGVEAFPIEVEVDVSPGLPGFNMVGLPEGAVKESRERVKAAIKNCGYPFPTQRVTVNLAPADIKKDGTGLDLPIACAILAVQGIVPKDAVSAYCLIGELSLDGTVKSSRGVLPLSISSRNWGLRGLVVPEPNGSEAAVVKGAEVYPVTHLSQVVEFLSGRLDVASPRVEIDGAGSQEGTACEDFNDIIGQEHAKRALEVAAAGGHNVIMIGPPGSGKTMLARRLPGILPPLTFEEALETTTIYSVAGKLPPGCPLIYSRPFCSPHHTISDAGLIGGGAIPRPGQVSLAHNGVLFLDELPEFKKNVLEGLRQPMEDGVVTISRVSLTLTFPARFMLVAAQNPCPCGHYGDPANSCSCLPSQVMRYRNKVSGPLLDRIDIQLEVPAVPYSDLGAGRRGDPSHAIRKRVTRAREIQQARFDGVGIHCNAQMGSRHLEAFCRLSGEGKGFLQDVASRLNLSARAYHRVMKIARTIADLEGAAEIDTTHLAEAVQYRSLDRNHQAWQQI